MALIKIEAPVKYEVWITHSDGTRSLLTDGKRDSWSRRTAVKYAREINEKWAADARLIEITEKD